MNKDKLYITSTNAACYITVKTGVKASIVTSDEGNVGRSHNYFSFPKDAEVMSAFQEYREATHRQSRLNIDIIAFIRQFSKYKRMSKNAKR